MDNTTQENLSVTFGSLPVELQDAILEANVGEKIQDIGKKHGLNVEQMGALFLLVNKQMVGIISPENFPKELKQVIGISDDEKITPLMQDINTDIFETIRKIMQENAELAEFDDEEELETKEEAVLENAGIEIQAPQKIQEALSIQTPELSTPATGIRSIKISVGPKVGENDILQKSGIEMEQEIKPLPQASTINLKREDLLSSVENPPKTEFTLNIPESGIIENKLGGAFQIPKKESELKIKTGTPPSAPTEPKRTDPYREAV